MKADWTAARRAPGEEGPIIVRDRDAPPDHVVCLIPGNLAWNPRGRRPRRLLDEDDVARAALIVAAPALQEALAGLLTWAARMGGWEAECWTTAQRALETSRRLP